MNKFFDYLMGDMTDGAIRELLDYICRFMTVFSGDVPVEGKVGNCRFCASDFGSGRVRVHWVEVGQQRITVDAVV